MNTVDRLLNARESANILRISIPTFWRRVADGTVPPAIKIGNLSKWQQSDIVQVIEKAKAQRNIGVV